MDDIEILEEIKTKEQLYRYIMKRLPTKMPLEHEIFAIRDSRNKVNDYTICVNGYISLDAIVKNIEKTIMLENLIQENKKLEIQISARETVVDELTKENEELKEKNKELEKKLDIIKCNYEILQGEMDRIGIDTLGLKPGNSTDDVIEEIKNKDKLINKLAEQLTTPVHSKEWVIEYFKKEEEKEC